MAEAGLTTDGWIKIDPVTFETAFPGVYAIGDVTAVGTPRAGVFAEGHAAIAAQHIAARIRGTTSSAQYGGRGVCYLEFGADQVAMVDVTFFGDQRSGELIGPSRSWPPTRLNSARVASSAGSGATGRPSQRRGRRGRLRGFLRSGVASAAPAGMLTRATARTGGRQPNTVIAFPITRRTACVAGSRTYYPSTPPSERP